MSDKSEQSDATVCEACGTAVPTYDVVSYGSIERGYRELCTSCFNAEVASVLGLERFEHVRLQPVVMTDCAGQQHEFHFRIRLLGDLMALEAFELEAGVPAGYQFEILGEADGDPLPLLGSLIARMRRSLSVRYLVRDADRTHIAEQTVCGRIEWDESGHGRVPLLVIDGQDVSWDEFGRMLMSFEGWQFRVAIRDRSEEVSGRKGPSRGGKRGLRTGADAAGDTPHDRRCVCLPQRAIEPGPVAAGPVPVSLGSAIWPCVLHQRRSDPLMTSAGVGGFPCFGTRDNPSIIACAGVTLSFERV
jgi:hypothetical protein